MMNIKAQQFNVDINPYIQIDEPEVEIIDEDYQTKLKSDKKNKNKNRKFLNRL